MSGCRQSRRAGTARRRARQVLLRATRNFMAAGADLDRLVLGAGTDGTLDIGSIVYLSVEDIQVAACLAVAWCSCVAASGRTNRRAGAADAVRPAAGAVCSCRAKVHRRQPACCGCGRHDEQCACIAAAGSCWTRGRSRSAGRAARWRSCRPAQSGLCIWCSRMSQHRWRRTGTEILQTFLASELLLHADKARAVPCHFMIYSCSAGIRRRDWRRAASESSAVRCECPHIYLQLDHVHQTGDILWFPAEAIRSGAGVDAGRLECNVSAYELTPPDEQAFVHTADMGVWIRGIDQPHSAEHPAGGALARPAAIALNARPAGQFGHHFCIVYEPLMDGRVAVEWTDGCRSIETRGNLQTVVFYPDDGSGAEHPVDVDENGDEWESAEGEDDNDDGTVAEPAVDALVEAAVPAVCMMLSNAALIACVQVEAAAEPAVPVTSEPALRFVEAAPRTHHYFGKSGTPPKAFLKGVLRVAAGPVHIVQRTAAKWRGCCHRCRPVFRCWRSKIGAARAVTHCAHAPAGWICCRRWWWARRTPSTRTARSSSTSSCRTTTRTVRCASHAPRPMPRSAAAVPLHLLWQGAAEPESARGGQGVRVAAGDVVGPGHGAVGPRLEPAAGAGQHPGPHPLQGALLQRGRVRVAARVEGGAVRQMLSVAVTGAGTRQQPRVPRGRPPAHSRHHRRRCQPSPTRLRRRGQAALCRGQAADPGPRGSPARAS